MVYIFVGIGGVAGSLLRFFLSLLAGDIWGKGFPIGTLLINLTGAFLLGWFTGKYVLPKKLHPYFLTAFSTGFIGSYTTFSTFCLETINLLKMGDYFNGVVYVLLSLVGGLLFVSVGKKLGQSGKKVAGKRI